jgi:hypothetical protein
VSEITHTYLGQDVKQVLYSSVVIASRKCRYIHNSVAVAWLTWEDIVIIIIIIIIITTTTTTTAMEFSLGGSSPETSTGKTNKNK